MTRFLRVRAGLEPPAFMRCRAGAVDLGDPATASDDELRRAHQTGMADLRRGLASAGHAGASLLDVKAELARRALRRCRLCPNDCGVDRTSGEVRRCGVGARAHVAAEMVHLGEVEELAPAHAIFLSGCTMRCIYCRRWELIEHPDQGDVLEPAWFAERVRKARSAGARAIKLLGGTPEPHVAALLDALRSLDVALPVVWESTMYISEQCLGLIEGTVDLVVANLRYGSDQCARELSGVGRYVEPALTALRHAMRWTDVTVRHLVLPGHIDCCTRPLAEMLQGIAPEVEMMLLMQYVPFWQAADHPPLDRRLTAREREEAVAAVGSVKERWSVSPLA